MMKEGMNKLDEELMAKFLMGECSEEELCKVNAWLNESGGNARVLLRFEQLFHLGMSVDFADDKMFDYAEKEVFIRLAHDVVCCYVHRYLFYIRFELSYLSVTK